jgi:small-conductance mechanosensitive channel
MTTYRLTLGLAGAVAVAAIGFSMMLAHKANVPGPVLVAMLLGTYALGLGAGGLVLNRRG